MTFQLKETLTGSVEPGWALACGGAVVVGVDPAEITGDRSAPSVRAATYAADLARLRGSPLVAVWVRPDVAFSDTFEQTAETIALEHEASDSLMRKAISAAIDHEGIPFTALVVSDGDPVIGINRVAGQADATAIVVGASAHRIGSLTARLVRDATRPIIVVP